MGGYIIAHQLAARDTPLPSRGIAHAHASHAPSFVILPVDCDGSQFRYPRGSTLRLSDVQSVTEPLEPLPRSVLHKRQQQPSPVAHPHRYRMPLWPMRRGLTKTIIGCGSCCVVCSHEISPWSHPQTPSLVPIFAPWLHSARDAQHIMQRMPLSRVTECTCIAPG